MKQKYIFMIPADFKKDSVQKYAEINKECDIPVSEF